MTACTNKLLVDRQSGLIAFTGAPPGRNIFGDEYYALSGLGFFRIIDLTA